MWKLCPISPLLFSQVRSMILHNNSKQNFECNTTLLRNLGGWSMKHNNKCTFMILIKLHWHPFAQKCSQIEICYFANKFFYQHTKHCLTHIQKFHKPHKCNINMLGKSLIPFQFYKPCNTKLLLYICNIHSKKLSVG
jgi:hypothetical protein